MSYFDSRPNLFRLILASLAGAILVVAAINIYRYGSVATDENLFHTTPSNLLITQELAATLETSEEHVEEDSVVAPGDNGIHAGDLLAQIDDEEVGSLDELGHLLNKIPNDSRIDLTVLRPQQGVLLVYSLEKSALPDSFCRELPPSVYIIDVLKDGASDRAGIREGDLIVRINGQKFRDAFEADQIMRRGRSGNTIVYDLVRGVESLSVNVTLAKLGLRVPSLVFWFCGLVYLAVGFFIAMQRPAIQAARLTGLALMVFSFIFLSIQSQAGAKDALSQLIYIASVASVLFGTALWSHSSFYFPKEWTFLAARPQMWIVPYAIAALFTSLLAVRFRQHGGVFMLGMLLIILYHVALRLIYRKHCSREHKKLNAIIKWTCLAAVLTTVLLIFVSRGGDQAQLGFIGAPLMLIPLAYLYTIGRHRLLDLDLRIRRSMQYLIVTSFWRILLTAALLAVLLVLPKLDHFLPNIRFAASYVEILEAPMAPERRIFLQKIFLMLAAIGAAFLIFRIGRNGQQAIAQRFHRGSYNYGLAASELADVMATKLTMVDLAKGIVHKLAALMHLKRAGVLFLQNQKVCCCREAYGFDGRNWEEFCLAVDERLIAVLQKFRSEGRFIVDYLPPGIKEVFVRHGFGHIIPIRFKEKLVGVLLIGEKLSETPFHHEDLQFLSAVAKQASVAIENAFLYEELAGQERMRHELAIARRIQLASLPQTTPQVQGLEISGISIPATEVGGDYFDYLNGQPSNDRASVASANGSPNRIMIVVGDVSGKGTSAALYMSKLQGILRSLHGFCLSPRELFIRANHLVRQALERRSFVTTMGADFDPVLHQLVLARAGHLPLFHYRFRTQSVEKVTPRGLGLGLDDEQVFASELEEKKLKYEIGDVFLFVTDGITEAQARNGNEFGEESLMNILATNATSPAERIRDQVIAAVRGFSSEGNQHDDQTVVVVKATG